MNIIDSKLNFKNLVYGNNPNKIILHNTASKNASIDDVQAWHLANGWSGCGYHFLIRKDGTIYMGRPVTAIGAHCVGQNSTSIGVCFEGDFNTEKMGDKQIEAGEELISFLKNKYGIKLVKLHKDYNNTDCPGNNFPYTSFLNSSTSSNNNNTNNSNSNIETWVLELQKECNRQGFSKQVEDGIAGPNTLHGCPVLRYGAKGNITKLLQIKLNSLGFNCGTADGIFGNLTEYAVRAFQGRKGIGADGIVGQKTWTKLLNL